MDPSMIFAIVLGLFLACIVVYLATRPRRTPPLRGEAAVARHFRLNGGTHPRWKDHPTFPAQKIVRLSARDLERVNIKRKLADRRPLTRRGFTHGLAVAPQHDDHSGLLAWLLVFESVQPSHYSHRCAIESGITVRPNEPYNGLGGSYGGAGASGSWDAPAPADRFHNPQPDDRNTVEAAPAPAYSAPDPTPTPSFSAPEPTTSYSAPDTSSSYSSSDSSSSYSSSSDSGGGGGGGGGE